MVKKDRTRLMGDYLLINTFLVNTVCVFIFSSYFVVRPLITYKNFLLICNYTTKIFTTTCTKVSMSLSFLLNIFVPYESSLRKSVVSLRELKKTLERYVLLINII